MNAGTSQSERPANRRIGLYHPYPHRMGGSQLVTLLLARELPLCGYVPVIVCPEPGDFTEAASRQGTEVLICSPGKQWLTYGQGRAGLRGWLSPTRLIQLVGYWFQLGRDLGTARISLLHCNDLRAVVMASMAARIARIPSLWHLHTAPGKGTRRWLDAALALSTNHKVFVSQRMLEEWSLPRWVLGAHRVIINGLAKTEPAIPLSRSQAAPLLLTVGALHPRKGQDTLLRSMAMVRARIPDVKLWMAGRDWDNGDYERSLRALTNELNLGESVDFLGQRNDVAALMATVDVVVIPSRSEPFGMVALEAMAQSKPVVASCAGGLKDIVVHDETGLLVSPDDPAAMADAIIRLLPDRRLATRMGIAGRTRATGEFSSRAMSERFSDLYERMLAK